MTLTPMPILVAVLALAGGGAAGCGGSGHPASPAAGAQASTGAGASDAASAATGDIPDNQVFLAFADARAGYTIRYPEGWTRQGSAADVTFRQKGNTIRVVVAHAAPPATASVQAGVDRLKMSAPSLQVTGRPRTIVLSHSKVVKVSYSLQGSPDPVTGRRPLLLVDRYVYAKGGKVATVDLGTPRGVDNVDAYRLVSQSFAWR